MEVPLPLGDVLDRITILRIKVRRIEDVAKRLHARRELKLLERRWSMLGYGRLPEEGELEGVNEMLWEVEDRLRAMEARQDFDEDFVEAARSVYRLNDRRAALKAAVNEALDSELVEVKSYHSY
ncbi:MAG TPA: DUF6165 family protein [Myxococcota bacterium]|nr:DUF6165 family protein [Myxococcota bacterium]